MRPAVKTGRNGRERCKNKDAHSTQLDIIVYDSANYPIFQRFGDSVIVPPEGVIAIISIKKHLNDLDIQRDCPALMETSKLCCCKNLQGQWSGFFSNSKKIIRQTHYRLLTNLLDILVLFNSWSIFKTRPKKDNSAEYLYFSHEPSEGHLGFHFLLTGILSVFYDLTRNDKKRPGFTAFLPKRPHNGKLDTIPVRNLRD